MTESAMSPTTSGWCAQAGISHPDGKRMDAEIDQTLRRRLAYIDNTFEKPRSNLAGRPLPTAWKATGTMTPRRTKYDLTNTGDADHSLGTPPVLGAALQEHVHGRPSAEPTSRFTHLGAEHSTVASPLGCIWDGKKFRRFSGLKVTPKYGRNGVQERS